MPAVKKIKKKKKKKKPNKMLEYLMPTQREVSMADAYGGNAKGQFRRPGVKYDRERLQNRIKTPANIPGGRAQLEALAATVAGFNKVPLHNIEDSISLKGAVPILPGSKRPPYRSGGRSEVHSDAASNMGGSVISRNKPPRGSKNTDLREKRARAVTNHKRNNGDFEQMFGKDIDKYLEESEWDIDSYEKMSHMSKGSQMNSQNAVQLKKMEKAYLQRIETNSQTDKRVNKNAT